MGNTMSKMSECHHKIHRKELKDKIKSIAKEQSELELRMKDCKKEIEVIDQFKDENELPGEVSRALSRGQDELIEERYMLSSELFDCSQKIAEVLIEMIDVDMEAAKCCNFNKKKMTFLIW